MLAIGWGGWGGGGGVGAHSHLYTMNVRLTHTWTVIRLWKAHLNILQLSVLKAWVGLFLVKIDMLNCWLHFSNTQQCVGTMYILWIEICLVIKKKVATFWKMAHVSKRTANGKPHPAITWAQKVQHLDITNRGLSGCIINYSLGSNFLPGRIA